MRWRGIINAMSTVRSLDANDIFSLTREENDPALEPGSVIRIDHRLYRHVGIISDTIGVDRKPLIISFKKGASVVTEDVFSEEVGDKNYTVCNNFSRSSSDILIYAKQCIGKPRKPYGLLTNNCEHFVTFVTSGNSHSPQVNSASIGVAVGTMIDIVSDSPSSLKTIAKSAATGAVIGFLFLSLLQNSQHSAKIESRKN